MQISLNQIANIRVVMHTIERTHDFVSKWGKLWSLYSFKSFTWILKKNTYNLFKYDQNEHTAFWGSCDPFIISKVSHEQFGKIHIIHLRLKYNLGLYTHYWFWI